MIYYCRLPYCEFVSLLGDVLLAIDAREETGLLALLRKVMALAKEQGYANMWLWRPESMIRICEKALENHIEVDYVREMVRKLKLAPKKPPVHLENWPWELRIHTLGVFEMIRDDKSPVPMGKTKKPLELLKAIIALGGERVSEERLISDLWPDADGDFAHHAFETTLYRLRKLLGSDRIIKYETGKLSLDPRYCWIDTLAFERVCETIDTLCQGKAPSEDGMELLLEKASGLYRGYFLPADTDQPWTMWMREHLRGRFLHILTKAGGYWEGRTQLGKAIEWYQKGLRVDRLAEEFYQRLMVCYHTQGRTVEAVRTYQRCRSALAASLDLPPSPKTEQIYRRIIKK